MSVFFPPQLPPFDAKEASGGTERRAVTYPDHIVPGLQHLQPRLVHQVRHLSVKHIWTD